MDRCVILKYRSTYTGLHHTLFASEFTCHILSSELAMSPARRNRNVVKTFLDHSAFQRITENFIFFQKVFTVYIIYNDRIHVLYDNLTWEYQIIFTLLDFVTNQFINF